MAVCDETQTVGTQTLFDSVLNHAAILTETSTCSQLLLLSTVCQHQIVLGSAHFGMMRLSSKLTAMADFSSSDVSSAVICSLNNIIYALQQCCIFNWYFLLIRAPKMQCIFAQRG